MFMSYVIVNILKSRLVSLFIRSSLATLSLVESGDPMEFRVFVLLCSQKDIRVMWTRELKLFWQKWK
jgi:hypothetical protein